MRHARPRNDNRRRAVLPAVLLTVAGGAFGGLALAPVAVADPAPDVLAFTDQVAVVLPERGFDVERASRSRALRPPKPSVAPSPKPVATKAAPKPSPTRVRMSAPKVFGGRCPVPSATFTDTWGAPRSGGRTHKGTDLMASYGAPVYAVAAGIVDTSYSSNGGISLYLKAANGDRYFYAHNSKNIARDGERVQAGQLIARVGTSGNAQGTAPHVHFEREVGGVAVNPYAFLKRLCG